VNQYGEGIIIKKVILTNIVLFITVFCLKIWHFTELKKANHLEWIKGIGTDFFNTVIQISDDVLVIIPDLSIYVLLIGVLINLFFLCTFCKRSKITH
jgi:hypothetical protein